MTPLATLKEMFQEILDGAHPALEDSHPLTIKIASVRWLDALMGKSSVPVGSLASP